MNANHLINFLSGYFHEDWAAEAETDSEVVSTFMRCEGFSSTVEPLVAELEAAAVRHQRDTSDIWLLQEYGCYYSPSADGLSGSDWLRRLTTILKATKEKGHNP